MRRNGKQARNNNNRKEMRKENPEMGKNRKTKKNKQASHIFFLHTSVKYYRYYTAGLIMLKCHQIAMASD
jgi:hypothetical protein